MRAKTINESVERNLTIWDKYGENLPSIFKSTIYRIPTSEELNEINNFDLNEDDIIQGITYTIVGRGMNNDVNKRKIFSTIVTLSIMFPENQAYLMALEKLRERNESSSNIK